MKTSIEKLVEKTHRRLAIAVTISIFFPTLVASVFKLTGADSVSSDRLNAMFLGFLVSAYLLTYVLFETFEEKLVEHDLKWINRITLWGVASFIIPTIVMAMGASDRAVQISIWEAYSITGAFAVSLMAIMWIPALLIIALLVARVRPTVLEIFNFFKNEILTRIKRRFQKRV